MPGEDAQGPGPDTGASRKEMDALCDRIAANVPRRPYIMNVDAHPAYRPPPMLASNWQRSTFFRHEWEQYQTLLYRDPGENSLLSLTVDVDEQNKSKPTPFSPLLSTPKHSGKKISLSEYKKRGTNVSRPVSSQGASQASAGEGKTPVADPPAASQATTAARTSQPIESSQNGPPKRSHSELDEQDVVENANNEPLEPQEKRRALANGNRLGSKSSDAAVESSKPDTTETKPATGVVGASLPKVTLRSTHLNRIDESSPPWTSAVGKLTEEARPGDEDSSPPWLPDSVPGATIVSLDKLEFSMSAALTYPMPKEGGLTKLHLPKAINDSASMSPDKKEAESRPLKTSTSTSKVSATKPPAINHPEPAKQKIRQVQRPVSASSRPAPAKGSQGSDAEQNKPSLAKTGNKGPVRKETKELKPLSKAGQKRAHEEETVNGTLTPSKRTKTDKGDVGAGSPRTPKIVISQASDTTRSGAKAHTRASSSGTVDIKISRNRGAADTPTPSAALTSSVSDLDNGAEWEAEYEKVFVLAKSLKSQAAADMADTDPGARHRLACAKSIESVLCFCQAFTIAGRKTQQDPTSMIAQWASMIPYAKQVRDNCKTIPCLHAYMLLVLSFCHSRVVIEFRRYPPAKYLQHITQLRYHFKDLDASTAECKQSLIPALTKAGLPEATAAAQLLPIGEITKPMAIVRFGAALLVEWCKNEKVPWNRQHEQGMCSEL